MFLISQIKKDFLWDISYKITFYGQFISIALTVFTFFFISKTFSASESLYLDEYDNNYFFFAIIGISLVDLITLCLRSASQSIRDAQSFGYIDYLLNARIKPAYILVSTMIYPSLIGLIKIFVYFLVASFFTDFEVSIVNGFIIILLSFLSFIPFIGLALLASSFVMYYKQGDPVNYLISLFISLFSGVVFPITVLPDYLMIISKLIPLTYGLEMIRKVAIFNSTEYISTEGLIYMLIFCFFSLIVGVITLNKVINSVKISGSSGRY